jgi:putative DNA primase/helicase
MAARPARRRMAPAAIVELIDNAEVVTAPPDAKALAIMPRNDEGNAQRLMARHGQDLAYVEELGWGVWSGKHWDFSAGRHEVLNRALETAAAIELEADAVRGTEAGDKLASALMRWRVQSGNEARLRGMIKTATCHALRKLDDYDADPLVLNCRNVTLRLGAEGVRPFSHRRHDLLTRIADVDYDENAKAPRWSRFMDSVIPEDEKRFAMRRWLGYCLTGDTSQEKAAIFHGCGRNGKSTMVNAIRGLMGDYAARCDVGTFLYRENQGGSGPAPDVLRLRGVRFILPSEPEKGARLSGGRIKDWTGNDSIVARDMYGQRQQEFRAIGKLTFNVNPLPVVIETDAGIKARFLFFEFTRRFEAEEGARGGNTLSNVLAAERSGILNWLLAGFSDYLEQGLNPPREVIEATERYFDELDPIGQFVQLCCVAEQGAETASVTLYRGYTQWCEDEGAKPKSMTAFGRWMTERGFAAVRSSGHGAPKMRRGVRYLGLERMEGAA